MEEPLSKDSLRVPQNEMRLYEVRREGEFWVTMNPMLWQDSIWREEEDEVGRKREDRRKVADQNYERRE